MTYEFSGAGAGFSDDFTTWIAGAGYSAFSDDDRLVVANTGGEIRYYVASDRGGFTLTRAERAENEEFILEAGTLVQVERYLTMEVGIAVRSLAGYPRVRVPFAEEETAAGYGFVSFADGTEGLRRVGGDILNVRFRGEYVHPAVQFSYYADADPAVIRRSLGSSSGAPLFEGMVESRA